MKSQRKLIIPALSLLLVTLLSGTAFAQPRRGIKPTPGQVASVPYRQHPRYKGMVAHLLMNEGGGTTIRDVSGRNNDASINEITAADAWVLGQFGTEIDFPGTDDDLTLTPNFLSTKRLSISFWVNPDVASSGADIFIESSDNYNVGEGNFVVFFNEDETVEYAFNGNVGDSSWTSSSTLVVGERHHIVLTLDINKTSGELQGYFNGRLNGSQNGDANNTDQVDNETVFVGARAGTTLPFDGKLDDIRICLCVWNESQIWSLYTRPHLEFQPVEFVGKAFAATPSTARAVTIFY